MSAALSSPPASPHRARRVLFLNDLGFQYGAGIAQARQVQAMLSAGCEVAVLAWEPGDIPLEQVVTRAFDLNLWLGLQRVRHLHRDAPMTDAEIIDGIIADVARCDPDLIIAGNLHAPQWPLRLLSALQQVGYRVAAYMHDGYLFTGRCAYPESCQLYLTGCDASCPTAHEYPAVPPPEIRGQWELRRSIFNGPAGVEVVANSHWTRDIFRSALPQARSCETIYLAADETVYRPGDKLAARTHLGLPVEKPVLLTAAVNFQERRKGASYLRQVVETLGDAVTFVAFGHNADEIPGLIGLGYHRSAAEIALTFQAADLFVGTAVDEAFGQTILEAQLCGRPVAAFNAGGVAEIVRNEITGKLVPVGNAEALIAAIHAQLANAHYMAHAGQWARDCAVARFTLARQGQAWFDYLDGRRETGTGHSVPTREYSRGPDDVQLAHRPSWDSPATYVNEEHTRIFDLTSSIEGWQARGDSEKLYEMAYWAGDVILEIGTYGGRTATVELRGALANPARTAPPRFYGVDISPDSIARTRHALLQQGLAPYCHLFEGDFSAFAREWSIDPTMVFLDGDHRYEGVWSDMQLLSRYLRPGTPVLVHDFMNQENDTGEIGVRRAGLEWAATGQAKLIGCFGCAALFVTLPAATGA